MLCERWLVGVDKAHSVGVGVRALYATLAAGEFAQLRQESRGGELGHTTQTSSVGGEGRVHVEAVAAAGTRTITAHRRMAIGDEHHARQLAAEHGLERGAQLNKTVRQVAVQRALGL